MISKGVAIALLIAGTALFTWGITALTAVSVADSRMMITLPVDRFVCLMVGAVLSAAIGMLGLVNNSEKRA
jgi:hypothetical protein